MTEIARRTPKGFMDRVDGFINTKYTLRALMASQRTDLKQADKEFIGQKGDPEPLGGKKGVQEAKRRGEASARARSWPHAHVSLIVEDERAPSPWKEPRRGQESCK